jgi:hyperosmotically inducible protein
MDPRHVTLLHVTSLKEQRIMKNHILRVVQATLLVAVCATGVASAAERPDSWVTMKTKLSLLTTDGVSTRDLHVDTVNGVVTLHGQVSTEAQKVKAAEVTRRIEGAKSVKNLLQVVPSPERTVVKRSDDAIKKSVEAAFKANRRVNKSGIEVESVNNGVVLLSGKTKSMAANVESVEVANAVRGVRRVSTEVEVIPAS